ncbi:MAG: class I SAM-dependent methyltransferase [Gemmataceae bacterium]|nr:class I SAM-dependent methyltransferase [Gemmataceae bacterium]
MPSLKTILAVPAVYRLFGRVVGGNARATFVREYLRPAAGDRVLDLGCGPGDLLAYLPPCDYVGVDLDPQYVAAARARYGDRGSFRCETAEAVAGVEPGTFDLVIASGLLHHLTDEQADATLRVAHKALRPGGRFVSLDGCFVPGQSPVARWMLRRDRGRFVRDLPGYLQLAEAVFPAVRPAVRHDLLWLPYTHAVLECTRGAGG